MKYTLAVDLGTSGGKVGLVSLTGEIVWHDFFTLETQYLEGGGAEQDAGHWWTLVGDSARRALASGAVDPSAVAAVSVTGQWASTVPVDGTGEPVGPCVMWMDTRGGRHVRHRIGGKVAGYTARAAAAWIRKTGGAPSTTGADPVGHMLFFQEERPAVAMAAEWFLEPVDYLTMRFTGRAAASHASMTAVWLTDNRHLDRLEYDAGLVRMAGVDGSKLPPLVPTGSVVGTVQDDVAADLGLPTGVQVVTGTPDLHSAAPGTGTLGDHEAHMPISTTSWISCPVDFKKTDVNHQIASIPGITPDRYLVVNNHETAGVCLQWLRDTLFPGQPYEGLTALAAEAAPGSGGVIFTPWLDGERSPIDDRWARAGFHNLSIRTTSGEMVRAVLEGVAYNARWLHEAVEKFVKRRLDPIRIFGGGAQSDLWCQIHADVMGRTMERVSEPQNAGIRGAALVAGLALGEVRREEVRDLVKVEAVFTPDPGNAAVYEGLFGEFPGLYRAQKAMFRRLNRPVRS